MNNDSNLISSFRSIKATLPKEVSLVVVSKHQNIDSISSLYENGNVIFGENRVQELLDKFEALPKDIEWHMIGHLQTNKVKKIAPFIKLIHSVDSRKLLTEIDRQAKKNDRIIDCLLQVHIAKETSKYGFTENELESLMLPKLYPNTRIVGLMGMATNTDDLNVVVHEFNFLRQLFDQLSLKYTDIKILSMGMSNDYDIAIKQGANMVRIGSAIFQ